MNPPSALHSAMSRDRKPFTYTPGGIDLSEIKSSRMAARLMRNAMNEGVPELPKHIQSPAMSSAPIAVPNYNCMPVQVFPAFNLPANPKSLLRTRSNPGQQPHPVIQREPPPQTLQLLNNSRAQIGETRYDTFNKNTPAYSQLNNNRPVSMFEYGSPINTYTPKSYDNDVYIPTLPDISYDAEYLRMPPKIKNYVKNIVPTVETVERKNNFVNYVAPNNLNQDNKLAFDEPSLCKSYLDDPFYETDKKGTELPFNDSSMYQDYLNNACKSDIENKESTLSSNESNKHQENSENSCKSDIVSNIIEIPFTNSSPCRNNVENNYNPVVQSKENNTKLTDFIKNENNTENKFKTETIVKQSFQSDENDENDENIFVKNDEHNKTKIVLDMLDAKTSTDYLTFPPENVVSNPVEDLSSTENKKKEVKLVKKQVIKKENNVEGQNGSSDQNGESEVQAVVKLPTKKSAAKTETRVEVTKKTLPDGSIEEVKKTITKTTIDGRTEIKTKTETTIIPKEDDEEEVEEEVEEEEEEANDEVITQEEKQEQEELIASEETVKPKVNGEENITKTEERSEITTTTSKKVVVIQDDEDEQKEEEVAEENEESAETEPVTFVIKQPAANIESFKDEAPTENHAEEIEEAEEEEEEEEVEPEENKEQEIKEELVKQIVEQPIPTEKDEDDEGGVEEEEEFEEAEEKEEYEEAEATATDEQIAKTSDLVAKTNETNVDNAENIEEVDDKKDKPTEEIETNKASELLKEENNKQEQTQEITEEKQEIVVEKQELKGEKQEVLEETLKPKEEKPEIPEQKIPLREPSVPLEKVEDVEIKPIGLGEFLTKTHTENTEIITNITNKPTGLLTEINRIENIVTVNRTTKTLDQSYENITQQGVPTVKTYFTPHIDKISTSPQPARPYHPIYPPEPTTERRHSLLLERLSVERQMPSDIYQNNYQYSNQTVEQQKQWSQEPQAEVLTVSNVKPSQITNQQWYQQRENEIYNNVAPSPQPAQTAAPSWTQPKSQPQPVYPPQSQYQPSPQPQYHAPPQSQPQPQYQAPLQPQPQYQPTYTENIQENTSSNYQNTYSTYTPKPNNWVSNNTKPLSPIPTIITPNQPSQYSYLNKDSSESYQKTTQNYSSSSYVPPPWEQDSTYVAPDASSQNYYQPPPLTSSFSPAPNQEWKPNLPASKFSKTPPKAYIPPKPNQSFVKPVTVEPPRMPGRKTYYSEYERRYISVPESTYIPGESKFQPQPDPSPAYYYDNNEPAEAVEPQWRRELREFTEKSQSQVTTKTNVKPPWEPETKYNKAPAPSYTQTPTWSQTVRPQSWRERSFESEFVSQEWPKTNTLGRGRPLSSYGKETIPERTRGVSVDRYNPNSYQAPVAAEHPPVQTHTHIPPAPHATGYHNPNVPAYHARASAEPREQVSYQQPRSYREARASPFQSRSFKYLQWITGTED